MNENKQNQLSTEFVQKWITVQEKELVYKSQELEIKKQADTNSFEYAKMALEANVEDRQAQRNHNKYLLREFYIVIVSISLLLFVFLGVALYLNKDQIASNIIGAIMFFLTGVFSGYSLGKGKTKNQDPQP